MYCTLFWEKVNDLYSFYYYTSVDSSRTWFIITAIWLVGIDDVILAAWCFYRPSRSFQNYNISIASSSSSLKSVFIHVYSCSLFIIVIVILSLCRNEHEFLVIVMIIILHCIVLLIDNLELPPDFHGQFGSTYVMEGRNPYRYGFLPSIT